MLWWTDSLKTGNEKIDGQHKKMFELGTRILDLSATSNKEEIQWTFQELIDYTKKHFGEEEGMMKEHQYPKLSSHRELHQEFVRELHRILSNFKEQGPTEENVDGLKLMMVSWLVNHINEADKDFIQTL